MSEEVVVDRSEVVVLAALGLDIEGHFSQRAEAAAAAGDGDPDGVAAKAVAKAVAAWHKTIVKLIPTADVSAFEGLSTHDSIQGRRLALKAVLAG